MQIDGDALVAFVEAQHPRVLGTLHLLTGDQHLAEELAAETLAQVASHWPRVRDLHAPGPYVQRIAVNLARSWFRRRVARRRALARHGPDADVHHDADGADVIAVREAVAALPERQRACVALHHFADLTTAEVADALGIAPATVRSHLRDARATLRTALGDGLTVPAHDGDGAVTGGAS